MSTCFVRPAHFLTIPIIFIPIQHRPWLLFLMLFSYLIRNKSFQILIVWKKWRLIVSKMLKHLSNFIKLQFNRKWFWKIALGLGNPESMTIYVEAIQRIEKVCEIIYCVVVKVTPACVVLPKFFASLLNYCTTDLGDEALVLPLLMWFVFCSIILFIF